MTSHVVWRGPSAFNGEPIMAIAVTNSTNSKTGPMINVHIVRSDMSPVEAMRTGADDAICWTCPLRATKRSRPSMTGSNRPKLATGRLCTEPCRQTDVVTSSAD